MGSWGRWTDQGRGTGILTIRKGIDAQVARGIAWSLVGAYFALAGAGLFLMMLTDTTPGDVPFPILPFVLALAVVGILPVIGAMVVAHHPHHPIGWLLFATFPLVALDMFAVGYASYATSVAPASPAIPGIMFIWMSWTGAPIVTFTFTLMNLLFPTGRLISPRWRVVAWTSAGSLLAFLCLQAAEPGPLGLLPSLDNPYGVGQDSWAALTPLYWLSILLLVLCSFASVISLVVRLTRTQGDERQQLKWLIVPAFIFWIGIPWGVADGYDPNSLVSVVSTAATLVSVPTVVVAIAFSVFRFRLYDIDLIINRTLVYGALTASVVGLYALVVGGLGQLLQASGNPAVALVATGLIAVLFNPLRQRLQRAVNRLLYGERDEPFAILHRLGQRLEGGATPDDVLTAIVETVSQALKLPAVEITLRQDERYERAAGVGELPGERVSFPIQYQGKIVGYLSVAPRQSAEALGESDNRVLRQIASQAGAVVHAARLQQDLLQSRARLVTAREEERLRLRRDLHDGLGPVLASQGLKIAAVSHLLDSDPERARGLLDELACQNEATVAEIRRLVYDLRPPELDELGLGGAVREYASSLNVGPEGGTSFQVNVNQAGEGMVRLPAAVEVAAYRIATEALTNVTRHARADHCTVSLQVSAGREGSVLLLEVADDGVGLGESARAGVGLNSMRERAEEVRGELKVESARRRGTRIVASFPFAR